MTVWPDTLWKFSGYSITQVGREQKQNIFLLIIKRHLLGAFDLRFCLIAVAVRPRCLDLCGTEAGPGLFVVVFDTSGD